MEYILLLVGFILLIKGADFFVEGSSSLAGILKVPSVIIGLTIVALFLVETTPLEILRIATFSFLAGVICFLLALVCFLAETMLATRMLKFSRAKAMQAKLRDPPPA